MSTTPDAVHIALEHYVESRDYSALLQLRGTGGVAPGFDPKAATPQRVYARRFLGVGSLSSR